MNFKKILKFMELAVKKYLNLQIFLQSERKGWCALTKAYKLATIDTIRIKLA
jgi:hypothetical protein